MHLWSAVAAYLAALEERSRERAPLQWAISQQSLSNALTLLAAGTRERALLVGALDRMRDAAEVYREGGNSYWLPIAEKRIAEIEADLAAWPASEPAAPPPGVPVQGRGPQLLFP